jgi:phytanoyl-CoA hydroxylase
MASVDEKLPSAPAGILPVNTKFTLGPEITAEQKDFLNHYGFLHFKKVISKDEVEMIIAEMERIEQQWYSEGRKKVFGIPLFYGRDPEGKHYLQRLAFTSAFSEKIRNLVRDTRFEPIRSLIGKGARVGDNEKDGVVINRYINLPGSIYPKLGWHTDGLRDLFYGRMPQQMLNIGLHLDDCNADNGGLRLIPGSHNQGFFDFLFRKLYFVSHAPDPQEIVVETDAGDLTVHDGRLWHRVAQSQKTGLPSLRRSMYVPYLTGPYEPKDENSPTPSYHYLAITQRFIRNKLFGLKKLIKN